MPLYEFNCPTCGRFEKLMPMSEADRLTIVCACGSMAERMPSRVSMHADSLWAGHMTEHGYVTSSSKLAQIKRDKGIVELSGQRDVEGMKKVAAQGQKEKDEKRRSNLRKAFNKGFEGTGVLDSFGQLRPEALREDIDEKTPSFSAKVT